MNIFHPEKKKDNNAVAPIPERLRKNERIAIITADKTQDLEFFYPYYRLTEEGYEVDVITPEGGKLTCKYGLDLQHTRAIDEVTPADYKLLYIPGGKAPQELREEPRVLNFVREFTKSGKTIAAICHGPQVLLSAGVLKGIEVAAWPEIREELEEGGAQFTDEALQIDGQFITARCPGDLHRHLSGVIQRLKENTGEKRIDNRRPGSVAA